MDGVVLGGGRRWAVRGGEAREREREGREA
jgi:hypothetical protein